MKRASGMRIMMTTDAVGGVWNFSTTLACALGAAGVEVLLVCLGPRPTMAQRDALKGHQGVSLLESDLLLEWQDPAGTDLSRARSVLGAIADRFAPDLIHFNGFREASLDWKVPTVVVAHSCVNSWASACLEPEAFRGSEWLTYTSNVRASLRRADAWVAPTLSFRDVMARQYAVPANSLVIWNGVEGFSSGHQPKLPVILGAGRVWDKAKNLSALSSMAVEIDWPIKIAGPIRTNEAGSAIRRSGCEYLGEIAHDVLLREMEAASIFVSPALYEPFGLSVLEAAGARCALLLSDIPTFRELWEGAAIFFDPHHPEELGRCLQSLCRDPVQRARLQRAAADRAKCYLLRETANKYRELYDSLLVAGDRRPQIERVGVPA
jgi:glycosyltransferase involved in cell wall biosynthesis